MSISYHPGQGVVVVCDFNQGFAEPEMVKRRPAIVLCRPIGARPGLCTVAALSTTAPTKVMPYHAELTLPFSLPPPWDAKTMWFKGDMINTVSFHRLDLIRLGKDQFGTRRYLTTPVGEELMRQLQGCVLHALGLGSLTKSL